MTDRSSGIAWIPSYPGRKGHPSLFRLEAAGEIYSFPSMKENVGKDGKRVKYVSVSDEGVVPGMDTQEACSMIPLKKGGS